MSSNLTASASAQWQHGSVCHYNPQIQPIWKVARVWSIGPDWKSVGAEKCTKVQILYLPPQNSQVPLTARVALTYEVRVAEAETDHLFRKEQANLFNLGRIAPNGGQRVSKTRPAPYKV